MTRSSYLGAMTAIALTGTAAVAGGGTCASSQATACNASNPTMMPASFAGKTIVETAVENGNFKTLAAALGAANLVDALQSDGPFTVFAPTDAAFAKLPKGTVETLLKPENRNMLVSILTYHVVAGEAAAADVIAANSFSTLNGQNVDVDFDGKTVTVDGATVTTPNIKCSNGIIHVIDSVIMPSTNSILETAVEAGSFNTLAAALDAAGLLSTLEGDGPFTVFAPTDEAFSKLPAGTVETLLKPENKQALVDVLTYHVISGRVYAADAIGAQTAATIQGESVRIRIRDGRLMVNGASVVASDVECTNGVIHVIDAVILPPSMR